MQVHDPSQPRAPEAAWIIGLTLVLCVGAALRVASWGDGASLHSDELALYVNLQRYDGWRLISGRLDATEATQAAPPAFLLATDALMRPDPPGVAQERWLRLPSLIASLLSLPACLWFAWEGVRRSRLPTWPALLFTMSAMALSANLLIQSGRMKQYSGEVLAAALLPAMWLWLSRDEHPRPVGALRGHLLLGVTAAALVMFAYPAALIYASLVAADLLARRASPQATGGPTVPLARRWLDRLAPMLPGLLIGFGAAALVYLVSARGQRDPFLAAFWQSGFMDAQRPWLWPVDVLQAFDQLLRYVLPPLGVGLILFIACAAVALWREHRRLLAVLAAPLVATVAVATIGIYPFSPTRINLFLAPTIFVTAGLGFAWLWSRPHKLARVAAAVAASILLAGAAWQAGDDLLHRDPRLRAVGVELERLVQPGDVVISPTLELREHLQVYHPALAPPHVWYEDDPPPPLATSAALASPTGRAWLVVGGELQEQRRALAAETLAALPADLARSARTVASARGGLIIDLSHAATTRPSHAEN